MSNKIADIVSQHLFTYGSVGIPGFGSFSIADSSAGFRLENDVIIPPTQMIKFTEEVENDEAFIKYLKKNHKYSGKEAEAAVKNYSKELLNNLLNYGVADIAGIGKLRKYANNEYIFEPVKEYLNTAYYMLPEINLTPIDRGALATKAPIPTPVVSAPKAAVAAAASAPIVKAFTPEEKPVVKESVAKPIEKKPVEKPKPEVKKPLVEKKEEVKKSVVVTNPEPVVYEEEKSIFSELLYPLLGLFLFCLLMVFGYKGCNKLMDGEGLSISNPLASDKEETPAAIDTSDFLADKPKLQKYSEYLTKEVVDGGCVIVVGSFKKSRNAVRMKDKIVSSGLSPFTEVKNGFTRVGVLFPCEEHDLVGYIDTIRRTFDRKSWYLNPQMKVPN